MKPIGIVGYGYVGKAMGTLFSRKFNLVIYDVLTHPDTKDQLKDCGMIVVCVPTPASEDGSCDTSYIYDAAEMLDEYAPNVPVCIKSAVPPGTTDCLNERSPIKRWNVSPEYVGEGTRFVAPWKYLDPKDPTSHNFVIVGGPNASEVLDYFMAVMAVDAHFVIADPIDVELTKRFENTFLATKVTFVNEAAKICEAFGTDWKKVRELWLLDPRNDRSHTGVFKNEPGYGGKCFPKDMKALIHESRSAGYEPSLLVAVDATNEKIRGGV